MKTWIIICLLCIIDMIAVEAQSVRIDVTDFPPPGTVTRDTIYYSFGRKLRWSDFSGKVRPASSSAAISFAGFSYDAAAIQKQDSVFVDVQLQVYFVKSGSWARPQSKDAYSLSHEQLHLDIAKLASEDFKDSLLLKRFSAAYYPIEIHFLYWNCWRRMNQMQQQFDDETKHGMNRAAEASWEEKIRKALLSGSGQDSPRDG